MSSVVHCKSALWELISIKVFQIHLCWSGFSSPGLYFFTGICWFQAYSINPIRFSSIRNRLLV